MGDWHGPQGPFDIPDVPNYVPRRLKPWLFIFFVLIVQFSGGIYLAAATDMVGSTALMQEDILMRLRVEEFSLTKPIGCFFLQLQ